MQNLDKYTSDQCPYKVDPEPRYVEMVSEQSYRNTVYADGGRLDSDLFDISPWTKIIATKTNSYGHCP